MAPPSRPNPTTTTSGRVRWLRARVAYVAFAFERARGAWRGGMALAPKFALERELTGAHRDPDAIAGAELARENLLRERSFHQPLHRLTHRPCSQRRIEP